MRTYKPKIKYEVSDGPTEIPYFFKIRDNKVEFRCKNIIHNKIQKSYNFKTHTQKYRLYNQYLSVFIPFITKYLQLYKQLDRIGEEHKIWVNLHHKYFEERNGKDFNIEKNWLKDIRHPNPDGYKHNDYRIRPFREYKYYDSGIEKVGGMWRKVRQGYSKKYQLDIPWDDYTVIVMDYKEKTKIIYE